MSNKLIVGIIQINTRDNVHDNFVKLESMIAQLKEKGAQIIVCPEYSVYNVEDGFHEIAQFEDGEIVSKFKELAKKYQVCIHNGSYAEKRSNSDKLYNTSLFINANGEIEARYRKIHLFDVELDDGGVHKESDEFASGTEVVVLSNQLGELGFTICYDLRFPNIFRLLTINGAKVIFLPAQFRMYTGKDHWEALLRARAIENEVYIVATCGFGPFPPTENRAYGNSMVVDPWGTVIARAKEDECCFTAELDFDYLSKVRQSIPCLANMANYDKLNINKIQV